MVEGGGQMERRRAEAIRGGALWGQREVKHPAPVRNPKEILLDASCNTTSSATVLVRGTPEKTLQGRIGKEERLDPQRGGGISWTNKGRGRLEVRGGRSLGKNHLGRRNQQTIAQKSRREAAKKDELQRVSSNSMLSKREGLFRAFEGGQRQT